MTAPNATAEEIVAAAKLLVPTISLWNFLMDTLLVLRGGGLSGGQRQRIAIARSVLQKPSLLILDEATSALDYLTERQVCLNLKHAFEGSTVFFITHRLSTIRTADQILMMDGGYLIEQGSHSELLSAQGGTTLSIHNGRQILLIPSPNPRKSQMVSNSGKVVPALLIRVALAHLAIG